MFTCVKLTSVEEITGKRIKENNRIYFLDNNDNKTARQSQCMVAVYKKKGEDVVSSRKKIMITLIIILLPLTAGVYGYGEGLFHRAFLTDQW